MLRYEASIIDYARAHALRHISATPLTPSTDIYTLYRLIIADCRYATLL